jgi:hypothetical protein
MKARIEYQNDEVTQESAVDVAEFVTPQITTAEQLADAVYRIIASMPLQPAEVIAELVEGYLRCEDVGLFLSCLSDNTLTMLADRFSDSRSDESRLSYPVENRGA